MDSRSRNPVRTLVKGRAPHYPSRTQPPGPSTSGRRHKRLLQLSPVPATPYVDQLSIGAGRRALAITLAVLIPALLLLMLLSFGPGKPPSVRDEPISVVSLSATEISEETNEPDSAEQKQADDKPVSPQPAPDQPQPPQPLPPPPVVSKAAPPVAPPSEQPPSPAVPKILPRPPGGAVYGPPDTKRSSSSSSSSSSSGDTERVGTAPNGEPLYAASWYREPRDDELRGYLSTASGPGWGLIACRTAPDYRVEDCVGLDEYPNGSQINRAVLAAAWSFQVRPPRRGGQPIVGAWVRIRIDYGTKRRQGR